MTVYVGKKLLNLVESGRVKIKPFDRSLVGEGSIDFRLGNKIRVFKKGTAIIDPEKGHKEYTKLINISDGYTLKPREFIHGMTMEYIELPDNLCGWIQGRSSLARIGLMVHITASLMHPGSRGNQILEIVNMSPRKIKLKPGIPVCQIIFEDTKGKAIHSGLWQDQTHP